MTEAAALLARFLHLGGNLLLIGALGFPLLAQRDAHPALAAWRRRTLVCCALVALTAVVTGVAVLLAQAAAVPGGGDSSGDPIRRLVFESRFGAVWLAREGLLAATTLVIFAALSRTWARFASPIAAGSTLLATAALLLAPFSGHSAALDPAWPTLAAHCLHLLAAGAWLGGLLAIGTGIHMTATRNQELIGPLRNAFARFSAFALPAMIAIVASGIWLAISHVDTFPALLGTGYGRTLVAKLTVLALVLFAAAHLRWKLLPRQLAGIGTPREFSRWVAVETALALVILALATSLARSVPARHDDIVWPLPFRASIEATWSTAWVPFTALCSLGATLVGIGLLAMGLAYGVRRHTAIGLVLAAAASATGLHAISVDAYPDTYRKPSIPYQTPSVAAGAELFRAHCTRCHGTDAHGGGPDAASLARRPADLTEPHTALHTAGDIYWWLTHGKPPGVMPGFRQQLSEDERWDLINFLRTLSAGYQARILGTRVVPGQPWLGAIDFGFVDQHGTSSTLKDFRGRFAVLLVFYTAGVSDMRLRQLTVDAARLRTKGAELVAIPVDGNPGNAQSMPFAVVAEGGAETVVAYSLLRRTLSDADAHDRAPPPAHMEFLIDRFGYIRARWMPADGNQWPDLPGQMEKLAAEPQIKPPPDDHVH